MTHEDTWNAGPQQYNVSGLDTRDRQEAEAAAEAEADDTFSISRGAFVRHIADAYKSGYAAGQLEPQTEQHIDNPLTSLPELLNRAAELLPSSVDNETFVIDGEGTFWKLGEEAAGQEKPGCQHLRMDWCGCGVGAIECADCGGHADAMDMGRGNIEIDDKGNWMTVTRPASMPIDEPKCSMLRARQQAEEAEQEASDQGIDPDYEAARADH